MDIIHPGISKYSAAVRMAIKAAARSDHYQHKIGCVIVRGGSIVSVGWNTSFIHSEHAAINRSWRSSIKGCTAIVIRIRRNGSFGIAKPCSLCMDRLIEAGIKKVVFSNQHGQLEIMRLPQTKGRDIPYLQYHFCLPSYKDKQQRVI